MNTLTQRQQAQVAKEIESTMPVPDWTSINDLKKFRHVLVVKGERKNFNFEDLVGRYKDLDAEIKHREGIKAEIKEAIEAAMLVCGEEKVLCSGYRVAMVTKQGQRKVSPELLLKNGVGAEVIAASMEVGKSSQYIDIRKSKE